MKPDEILKEVACDTAEELLHEMSPRTGRLWASSRNSTFNEREWIFRGVADATYPLRPSAFRGQAFTSFIPGQVERTITDGNEQRGMEDYFMGNFCTEADRREITVPSDRPELRDIRVALKAYDPHEFPPINKLHMFALGQHHGVPTRLLDWTRLPFIAAYFAVRQVAQARTKRPGPWSVTGNAPCAVWALDLVFARRMMFEAVKDEAIDPSVQIVTAPYATNPSLAAQGGLFTLVQPRMGDPHPLPDLDTVYLKMAERVPSDWDRWAPVLVKFTLPANQVRVALRMLHAEGVTAAAVHPGLSGVVEAMKERWAHQWAPVGQRS